MTQFNGKFQWHSCVYNGRERWSRASSCLSCLVLPSLSLLLAAKLLLLKHLLNLKVAITKLITLFVVTCVALPWQIDRPKLKILVGIFCQILEIMQEVHNNQDVQAGCDAFVESGADLLPFKCVIQ